ncbi:hypothetical protein PFLUV_G00037290 [Perca fluviatilis]|uniref:C-type lectin domain-containing protein n=1 Tax=Perca fluviatilis TaxID=8168 RepID=A0A6A5FL25_PERFL|nr:hypothetical protein PFLUV_G00037290 [Perca fluviatilis]
MTASRAPKSFLSFRVVPTSAGINGIRSGYLTEAEIRLTSRRTRTKERDYYTTSPESGLSGWTDDSQVDYSSWAPRQPDASVFNHEYCIEMNYWDWGLWNDAFCSQEKPYVCQVRV